MANAARVPLDADRWTPFAQTFRFRNIDLSGAAFEAQVRLTGDTPGEPLVDLATVTTDAEGLRLISVADESGVTVSTVSMFIAEATMEALPNADEIGNDLVLAWDMHITLAGLKQKRLYGPFTVKAGVTQ